MASLAGLDTQNQAWSSDRTKFGYRMLEKMGWKEGKGLGANQDGSTKHVRVRKKLGAAGIGLSDRNTAWDVPGKVATGLNDVLSRLQPVCAGAAGGRVTESKSTKRARGYYERRRAGKSVGNYSRQDLAEIFGGVAPEGEDGEEGKRENAAVAVREETEPGQDDSRKRTEKAKDVSGCEEALLRRKKSKKSSKNSDTKKRKKRTTVLKQEDADRDSKACSIEDGRKLSKKKYASTDLEGLMKVKDEPVACGLLSDSAIELPKVGVKKERKVAVKEEPTVEVKEEPMVVVKEEPMVEVKEDPIAVRAKIEPTENSGLYGQVDKGLKDVEMAKMREKQSRREERKLRKVEKLARKEKRERKLGVGLDIKKSNKKSRRSTLKSN